MLLSLPGKEGGAKGARLDIGRIFDIKYTNILNGMYDKVDMENAVG